MPAPVQTSAGRYTGDVPTYYVAGPQGFDFGASWWSGYYGSIDPYAKALFAAKLKAADPAARAAARAALAELQVGFQQSLMESEDKRERLHLESTDKQAKLSSDEWRTDRMARAAETSAATAGSSRVEASKVTAAGKLAMSDDTTSPAAIAIRTAAMSDIQEMTARAAAADVQGDADQYHAMTTAISAKLAEIAATPTQQTPAAKAKMMGELRSIPANALREDGKTALFSPIVLTNFDQNIEKSGVQSKAFEVPEVDKYHGGGAVGAPMARPKPGTGMSTTIDTTIGGSARAGGSVKGAPDTGRTKYAELQDFIQAQLDASEADFDTAANAAPLTIPRYDDMMGEDSSTLPADDEALSPEERKRRELAR